MEYKCSQLLAIDSNNIILKFIFLGDSLAPAIVIHNYLCYYSGNSFSSSSYYILIGSYLVTKELGLCSIIVSGVKVMDYWISLIIQLTCFPFSVHSYRVVGLEYNISSTPVSTGQVAND